MSIATPFVLPEVVLSAIANGTPAIQAYRQYLGYSISAVAVTSGLTVEEVERIEAGYRFEKGYRDRIALSPWPSRWHFRPNVGHLERCLVCQEPGDLSGPPSNSPQAAR